LALNICFINCTAKIDDLQNKPQEHYNFKDIKLNKNSMSFDFYYNEDNYFIRFFGKEITYAHISKNFDEEDIPALLLDFENLEDKYIIDELRKSKILNLIKQKMKFQMRLII
jgi:hypothetical protein